MAESKQIVKIKGKQVFLNNELIGERSFIRDHHKRGIEISGVFIFKNDGKRYRFDSSCFGYSRDADNHIRFMLGSGKIDELVKQSEQLNAN